jgi:hypothetical protein
MGLQGLRKSSLVFKKVQGFDAGFWFDANSIKKAFNMGNDLAKSLVYGNHLLNGNMITDLMSIGEKTPLTGIDPPPCTVGGLNDHTTFEGALATL